MVLSLDVPSLTALTVTTTSWSTASTTAPLASTTLTVSAHHSSRRRVRALLLDVGLRHELGRQVEPLAQIVETLGGEGVVVPLPAELGLEETTRGKRLARLDHEEVLGVNVVVLGLVEVLLRNEYTLAEEVLVDLFAVGLGDEPEG